MKEISTTSIPQPGFVHSSAYSGDVLHRLQHWQHRHMGHYGELCDEAAAEIIRLKKLLLKYSSKLSRAEDELRRLKNEPQKPPAFELDQ